MRLFGFGKLTLDEAFKSYGKIVQYCDARAKRNKPCLRLCATGLQQVTFKLIDKSPREADKSLKITREIDGGRSGWVKEEVELTLLKTGDFETIIDEVMDRAGRAEKDGAAVSLGEEKGIGVTINCRTPTTLMCLLIARLTSRKFGLYYSQQQKPTAPSAPTAPATGGKKATAEADEAIAECRRWLADYQRRADLAGAKFDDMPEYIKCIQRVGAIGRPEAIKVLEQVRAGAMFAEILQAAVAAMDQAKHGSEKPLEKCARYLAQQEAWAKDFNGKAIENWEFGNCFKELKALNTPEATAMLKKVAESEVVFADAREAARIAMGQEPRKKGAAQGNVDSGSPDFGGDLEGFLSQARILLERLSACDRGLVLEQFYRAKHELPRPREAGDCAAVLQSIKDWATLNKGRPSFRYFRIQYQLNQAREDGGNVQLVSFHEGQHGPYFTDCYAKPARDRWYFWY
jgi:hypothetical protein